MKARRTEPRTLGGFLGYSEIDVADWKRRRLGHLFIVTLGYLNVVRPPVG